MTYEESLKYLDGLIGFGIRPGLERINSVLSRLDFPQKNYRTIHVTGTNGKGSVSAMLAAILKADGQNVGLFTSPHLESYCERISVNCENISEQDFADAIDAVKNTGVQATHFETLTAAAFFHFARKKVDIAVIEVGIGGTYDSTNVITPEVSIITTVATEHENVLGDLKSIAANKAGIIKPNVPAVTGAEGVPLEIICAVAKKNNSALYEISAPANVETNLSGDFQKFNAAIAIRAAEILGIDERTIKTGLMNVKHPGRFEVVKKNSGTIVIDGAHNPHGAKALRASLDKYFPTGNRVWIFGVLSDKNFDEMIKILFRQNDFVIVTAPNSERAEPIEKLCEILTANGIQNIGVKKNSDAVKKFLTCDAEIKIAAGSLYLIGNIRGSLIR